MARAIKLNDLEQLCDIINKKFGEKKEIRTAGEFNIGTFYISQGNGGVNLCRVSGSGGSSSDPITSGHKMKRELYNQMLGFIRLHDLMDK